MERCILKDCNMDSGTVESAVLLIEKHQVKCAEPKKENQYTSKSALESMDAAAAFWQSSSLSQSDAQQLSQSSWREKRDHHHRSQRISHTAEHGQSLIQFFFASCHLEDICRSFKLKHNSHILIPQAFTSAAVLLPSPVGLSSSIYQSHSILPHASSRVIDYVYIIVRDSRQAAAPPAATRRRSTVTGVRDSIPSAVSLG